MPGGARIETRILTMIPESESNGTTDVIVVVDVIRAFTTVCALFERGVQEVYCAPDLATALSSSAHATIIGEAENGEQMHSVLPNSPSVIARTEIAFQRAIVTTLNGTRVLFDVQNARYVLAMCASNVTATALWILSLNECQRVDIIVSDPLGNEDRDCARFLSDLLAGRPGIAATLARAVREGASSHWSRWGRYSSASVWNQFSDDVTICQRVDTFASPLIVRAGHGSLLQIRLSEEMK